MFPQFRLQLEAHLETATEWTLPPEDDLENQFAEVKTLANILKTLVGVNINPHLVNGGQHKQCYT